MPLPVIANTYRVALLWSHSDLGSDAVNVMHFRKAGATPVDLATKIDSHVGNTMWNFQDSHAVVNEVDVTPLDGTTVTYPFLTGAPTKWKGFSSSHDVIPQGAAVMKILTAKRGRSYRGRLYLPWVAETFSTNGVLDATTVTNMTTAWSTFVSAMSGDGYDLVVASYLLETAEDAIAIACEPMLATQRRRLKR